MAPLLQLAVTGAAATSLKAKIAVTPASVPAALILFTTAFDGPAVGIIL